MLKKKIIQRGISVVNLSRQALKFKLPEVTSRIEYHLGTLSLLRLFEYEKKYFLLALNSICSVSELSSGHLIMHQGG